MILLTVLPATMAKYASMGQFQLVHLIALWGTTACRVLCITVISINALLLLHLLLLMIVRTVLLVSTAICCKTEMVSKMTVKMDGGVLGLVHSVLLSLIIRSQT